MAPSDGGSRSVFRTRPSAPGAAREGGGQQGPTAPTREKAAWPGGCGREMEQQVTGGTDRDQGTGIGGEGEEGVRQGATCRDPAAQGTAAQGAHGGDLASGRSVGHRTPDLVLYRGHVCSPRSGESRGINCGHVSPQLPRATQHMGALSLLWMETCVHAWPACVPADPRKAVSVHTALCARHHAPRLRTHKHAPTPSSRDSSVNSGVWPTPALIRGAGRGPSSHNGCHSRPAPSSQLGTPGASAEAGGSGGGDHPHDGPAGERGTPTVRWPA